MKKIQFVIATSSGTKRWKGYESRTPGLVVCGSPYHSIDDPIKSWRIVHLDSGRLVQYCWGFDRRWQAEKVAQDIAQFADWAQDEDTVREQFMHVHPITIWNIAHQFDDG